MWNLERRQRRGFTLIELVTVIAIAGILASLAAMALTTGFGRARLNNGSFDVASLFSLAPMRAQALGTPQFIVFWENAKDEHGAFLLEGDGPADWAAVDVAEIAPIAPGEFPDAEPASFNGKVTERSDFESRYVSLVKLTGEEHPVPFRAVPNQPGAGTKLREACSFCISVANGVVGAIRFSGDGTARIETNPGGAPLPPGGSISYGQPGSPTHRRTFAIAAPSGIVRTFH